MKNKIHLKSLIVGALAAGVIVFSIGASTGSGARTRWEYTNYYYGLSHPDLNALNKLGADGWELVSYVGGADRKTPGFIFKRPKAGTE